MLLQFCDKCGRPLSEGAIARGEAVERAGETVCATCLQREREQVRPPQPASTETGPLGQYTQAVWHCESCGIPVNALDLIEGRASRAGSRVKCVRCAPQPASFTPPAVSPPSPAVPMAGPQPARVTQPARAPLPPARAPIASRPAAAAVAQELIAESQSAQRRPVLPILLFAIVLPMFAISLYFAISSQQKLNEAMAMRDEAGDATSGRIDGRTDGRADRREQRPADRVEPTRIPPPETGNTSFTPPPVRPEPEPQPAKPAPAPLAAEAVQNLLEVENTLAAPVIAQLQSKDLGEVWEGLLAAGSRRLVATRPFVRALLAEPHDGTRALACRVCAMLADTEALLPLSRMIESDPSEAVRTEARKARDRMVGEATREVSDMSTEELEKMLRQLQEELERRK